SCPRRPGRTSAASRSWRACPWCGCRWAPGGPRRWPRARCSGKIWSGARNGVRNVADGSIRAGRGLGAGAGDVCRGERAVAGPGGRLAGRRRRFSLPLLAAGRRQPVAAGGLGRGIRVRRGRAGAGPVPGGRAGQRFPRSAGVLPRRRGRLDCDAAGDARGLLPAGAGPAPPAGAPGCRPAVARGRRHPAGPGWIATLREMPAASFPLEPPQLFLPAPLVPGREWTWEGEIMPGLAVTARFAVLDPETVETPVGVFETVPVLATVSVAGETSGVIRWYAEDVGVVRQQEALSAGEQAALLDVYLVEYAVH